MASTHDLKVDKIFSVKGYVCVVTGGGTGIGLMCTQALAANGARVYITGRRMEVLEKAAKEHHPGNEGEIIPIGPCDVTKKEDLERIYKEVAGREKYIDLLVANAGISGPKVEPSETSAQDLKDKLWNGEDVGQWSDVFSTNVSAVYFTTVVFLPLLQAGTERQKGHSASVVTISSMSGLMANTQGHFSYNAAKGATVQLTKLMSGEFEKANIRVNSIAPGYFPSEMTAKSSDERQKSKLEKPELKDRENVPAQRAGSDEEMAQAVVGDIYPPHSRLVKLIEMKIFLAKNMYVNGQILVVDGGALLKVPKGQ